MHPHRSDHAGEDDEHQDNEEVPEKETTTEVLNLSNEDEKQIPVETGKDDEHQENKEVAEQETATQFVLISDDEKEIPLKTGEDGERQENREVAEEATTSQSQFNLTNDDKKEIPLTTGEVDENQEKKEVAEEETITIIDLTNDDNERMPLKKRKKRKRRDMEADLKQLRLLREKLLKRPIVESKEVQSLEAAPPAAECDSESEGEGEVITDRECALIIEAMPQLAEVRGAVSYDLPQEIQRAMNFMGGCCSGPNFVMAKKLGKADVDERCNRLVIPQRKIRENFMELEEEEKLNQEKWMMVEIIEPDSSVSLMTLSKWETRKGPAYVMITEWHGLVERNELKEGDTVNLWSFRAGGGGGGGHGRLCFLVVEEEGEEGGKLGPTIEDR